MKKCIIWGIGDEYERIINQICFEIYKGNIEIEALICRQEDMYCSCKDGFQIIKKEELRMVEFDYLIISSSRYYSDIRREAIECGIDSTKIINGSMFLRPFFDFNLYSNLISNPVTILSDDCWGGFVYNYLGLEFSSPLINTYWNRGEYSKFIQNPIFYLQTELKMVREGNLRLGIVPIARLGTETDYVQIDLVHNRSFEEAKYQWNRRIKRINFNNLFIKMGFSDIEEDKEKYLRAFERCRFRKVLFYNGDESIKGNVIKTNRFIWKPNEMGYVKSFNYNDFMLYEYPYVIDIFKLLSGKTNYAREL